MPRPKSKSELLYLSQANFEKLVNFIDAFSKEEQEKDFPPGTLNRNIRDVLAHLHHWHLMMLEWYTIGMKGEKPDMPAKGYSWKMTSELNKAIHQQYKDEALATIQDKLKASHQKIMALIEQHSNDELFEKKRYHWTGSTSLGAYLISSTSSHYDWAYKLIRKAKK